MIVHVHVVLTGDAARIGGVRFQQHGKAVIFLACDLSVEEQGAYLAELTGPDDRLDFSQPFILIPNQSSAPAAPERAAG